MIAKFHLLDYTHFWSITSKLGASADISIEMKLGM